MTTQDLTEPAQAAEAFPIRRGCPFAIPDGHSRLRAVPEKTVQTWDGKSVWFFDRYEEVHAILTDSRFAADRYDPSFPSFAPGGKDAMKYFDKFIVSLDGEPHKSLRRLIAAEFSQARVRAFRPAIEEIVERTLETLDTSRSSECDLAQRYSYVVPRTVIEKFMGAPPRYLDRFFTLAGTMLQHSRGGEGADELAREMRENMDDLIQYKLRHPGDDLLSHVIEKQYAWQGEINIAQLASLAQALLIGGRESTTEMLSLCLLTVLTHDEIRSRIGNEPSRIRPFVTECTRFFSPIEIGIARYATEDVQVGALTVKKGEGVIASTYGANHDPLAFLDPDTIRIDRDASKHLAQGAGPHRCLGISLATTEIEIAVKKILDRYPTMKLACPIDNVVFRNDSSVYGVEHMPVLL